MRVCQPRNNVMWSLYCLSANNDSNKFGHPQVSPLSRSFLKTKRGDGSLQLARQLCNHKHPETNSVERMDSQHVSIEPIKICPRALQIFVATAKDHTSPRPCAFIFSAVMRPSLQAFVHPWHQSFGHHFLGLPG